MRVKRQGRKRQRTTDDVQGTRQDGQKKTRYNKEKRYSDYKIDMRQGTESVDERRWTRDKGKEISVRDDGQETGDKR
jgi:hypothetical protein